MRVWKRNLTRCTAALGAACLSGAAFADPAFELADVAPTADVTTVLTGALAIGTVMIFFYLVWRLGRKIVT